MFKVPFIPGKVSSGKRLRLGERMSRSVSILFLEEVAAVHRLLIIIGLKGLCHGSPVDFV